MFVYYFSGNLVFGLLINLTLIHWVDRPIYAAINLKEDVRDAEESKYYRLNNYLSLFKGQEVSAPLQASQISEEVEEEIQEALIDKIYAKEGARFDSGATDGTVPRMATAATENRPTAFGSGPQRGTDGGTEALRFSDE